MVKYTDGNKFKLDLSATQVHRLVALFLAMPLDVDSELQAGPIGHSLSREEIRKPHPSKLAMPPTHGVGDGEFEIVKPHPRGRR